MNIISQAKQARIYAPIAFELDRKRAEQFWTNNHFIDKFGEIVYATVIANKHGILSVIFPDGSMVHYY